LRELSAHFQMTPAWISTIINSDAFQTQLALRKDQCFTEVTMDLRAKMEGVADAAVEKLGVVLENVQDPKMVLDIADKTLHRLGYAPQRGGPSAPTVQSNTQVNLYGSVDATTLATARGLMKAKPEVEVLPAPEPPVDQGTETDT
jgi:hypothetical protein